MFFSLCWPGLCVPRCILSSTIPFLPARREVCFPGLLISDFWADLPSGSTSRQLKAGGKRQSGLSPALSVGTVSLVLRCLHSVVPSSHRAAATYWPSLLSSLTVLSLVPRPSSPMWWRWFSVVANRWGTSAPCLVSLLPLPKTNSL